MRKVGRFLDELKRDANPEELLGKILDTELKGITGREVLACSDLLQKILFKSKSEPRSVQFEDLKGGEQVHKPVQVLSAGVEGVEAPYVIRSPKIRVRIGALKVLVLVDCGAEADLIVTSVAEAAGLPVQPKPRLGMVGHLG